MGTITGVLRPCTLCAVLCLCLYAPAIPLTGAAESTQATVTEVTRDDIFVPHVSTVPANAGQRVGIAVRHIRATQEPTRGAVLFTNPGASSSVATLDVDHKTYSLPAALAQQRFDVYLMDHTGVGRSPHPTMDDPCNADPAEQHLLIPNPLPQPCHPTYPHNLVTLFTEVDEVNAVVDYILERTGREKIALAGWSRALFRLGLYAAQHPDKVERIAIVGPGYRPDAPNEFPQSKVSYSFQVRTVGEQFENWERQRRCEDIVEPGVNEALLKSFRANIDPGAAGWGTPPGELYRSPTGSQVDAGWNRTSAARVRVPTLIVVGEHDPRSERDAPALYGDIGSKEKILVKVQCATHFVLWERNHQSVHKAFTEFLTSGTVNGRQGVMTVDRHGTYLQ